MSRRARNYVLATMLAVVATLTTAPRPGLAQSPVDDVPAQVGAWVAPFEEGGAETPRCRTDEEPGWAHGSLICKPAAADMIALPDGRVLYWDGLEGSVDHTVGTELASRSRNAQARVGEGRPLPPGDGVAGLAPPHTGPHPVEVRSY